MRKWIEAILFVLFSPACLAFSILNASATVYDVTEQDTGGGGQSQTGWIAQCDTLGGVPAYPPGNCPHDPPSPCVNQDKFTRANKNSAYQSDPFWRYWCSYPNGTSGPGIGTTADGEHYIISSSASAPGWPNAQARRSRRPNDLAKGLQLPTTGNNNVHVRFQARFDQAFLDCKATSGGQHFFRAGDRRSAPFKTYINGYVQPYDFSEIQGFCSRGEDPNAYSETLEIELTGTTRACSSGQQEFARGFAVQAHSRREHDIDSGCDSCWTDVFCPGGPQSMSPRETFPHLAGDAMNYELPFSRAVDTLRNGIPTTEFRLPCRIATARPTYTQVDIYIDYRNKKWPDGADPDTALIVLVEYGRWVYRDANGAISDHDSIYVWWDSTAVYPRRTSSSGGGVWTQVSTDFGYNVGDEMTFGQVDNRDGPGGLPSKMYLKNFWASPWPGFDPTPHGVSKEEGAPISKPVNENPSVYPIGALIEPGERRWNPLSPARYQ